MIKLDTILYPTDFSKPAQVAFQLACSVARDHGAKVIILHVSPPTIVSGDVMAPLPPEDYKGRIWESFRALQATDPRVRELRIEIEIAEGDTAREIVAAAKKTNADLIVMGTHGRTGLPRLILGSVAEQVLRKAPCPVLTVKSPTLAAAKTEPSAALAAAR